MKPKAHQSERVAVASLKEHHRNYREHPDDQLEHIAQSILENGFYRNVVVAKDMTILAGHASVLAAKRVGLKQIPVVKLNLDPDDPRALKLLAGDNETGRLAEVDDRALTEMLKEINDKIDDGLLGTGFDESMLANLAFVSRSQAELENYDAAADWAGLPSFERSHEYDEAFRLLLRFKTEKERDEMVSQIGAEGAVGQHKGKLISIEWPPRTEQHDWSSVSFKGAAK